MALVVLPAADIFGPVVRRVGPVPLEHSVGEFPDIGIAVWEGQGALAVQIRIDDEDIHQSMSKLDDPEVSGQVRAERSFLFEIGGDCHTPIAVHASIHGIRLRLRALVLSADGRDRVEGSAEGELGSPELLGMTLGRELMQRGANRLIGEHR